MLQKSLLMFFGISLLSGCTVPEISIEKINFVPKEITVTNSLNGDPFKAEGVLVAEIKSDIDFSEYAKDKYSNIWFGVQTCDSRIEMNIYSSPIVIGKNEDKSYISSYLWL